LKRGGVEALAGNAADPEIIAAANLGKARCLFVAIPDALRVARSCSRRAPSA
jgi:CPA2 family monovalent cation:H+ antiporter-2